MSYLKKLARGTFHSFGSMILIRILSLSITILGARMLGPANLGIYEIFQNIHSIFGALLDSGSAASVAKYTAEYKIKNKKILETFLSTAFTTMFLVALSIAILYFCSSDVIANRIYGEPLIALLMKIGSIILILSAIINFEQGFLQGLQKIKDLALVGITYNVICLVITYIFLVKMSIIGAVLSSFVGAVINILLYLRYVNKQMEAENLNLKFEINKNHAKKIINYSLPLFIASIILRPARLYGYSFLAIRENFLEVGYFKVAFGLYNLISFIPSAISVPLIPLISEISSLEGDKSSEIYSKIIRTMILLMLPFTIMAGLMAKYIILVLYGKEYLQATLITHVLIISSFFGAIASLVENLFMGTGETWEILYLNIYMSLVFVFSSYFFISSYGAIGLGLAWLIVDMTTLPLYLYLANKNSHINLSFLKLPLLLSLISVIITILIQGNINGNYLFVVTILYTLVILIVEYKILENYEKKILEFLLQRLHKNIKR